MQQYMEIAIESEVPMMFWGPSGIGKTTLAEQLNYREDLNCFVLSMVLSQYDIMVLGGYPGREVNEVHGVITTWAKPDWLVKLEDAANTGKTPVLFLDEFNRADKFTLAASLRLVNERAIGGHKLPEGTIILAACNYDTEGDYDVQFLNEPTMLRWCHVQVKSESRTWLDWASKANVNRMFMGYIAVSSTHLDSTQDDDALFSDQVAKRLRPCPRTNKMASDILNLITNESGTIDMAKLSSSVYSNVVAGLIGAVSTDAFIEYAKDKDMQLFTIEDMINPTEKVLKKLKMFIDTGNLQVVNQSIVMLWSDYPKRYGGKLDVKDIDPQLNKELKGFWKFLMKVPVDIVVAFFNIRGENFGFWLKLIMNKEKFAYPDDLKKRVAGHAAKVLTVSKPAEAEATE